MWNGEVTLYSPNGDPIQSFHADDMIPMYAEHPPVIAFIKGAIDPSDPTKHSIIMETNVPFVMEINGEKRSHAAQFSVRLIAANGKVVREFVYTMRRYIFGIWEYVLCDGNLLCTSFPSIQVALEGQNEQA